jgi:hypothetical protein
MKKKLILKIVITLFVSLFLISCSKVHSLTERNALLASGVSFDPKGLDSSKIVVISSVDGKKIQSCEKINIIEKNNISDERLKTSNQSSTKIPLDQQCNNEIVANDPDLLNALRIKNSLDGFVIKDGVRVPAKFVVTVTAVYKGSHCNSLYGLGAAYTNCIAYDF